MAAQLSLILDGITHLPARHIATIKTYLEMSARPGLGPESPPEGFALVRLTGAAHARYRAIFGTLGRRWLWWSRLMLDDAALAAVLHQPVIEAYAVTCQGCDAGLLELDFSNPDAPDLAFLGLFDGHTGMGVGSWLMREAQLRLWRVPAERITVNTCTLDHPTALGFYRHWGFRPVAQAVEIVADPRLSGLLPADAAPHVPVLP